MMIRFVGGIFWLIVLCASVFGCGATDSETHGNPGPERVEQLENGLRSKPSFEAAQAEYSAAMNLMADKIAALVPGIAWHVDENSWRGCGGDYVWTRAKQVDYLIVFDKAIPDDTWPRALQVVKDGVARFGATNVSVFVNQPGNKDLAISGPGGADFKFGTAKQTIFSATSDCRMRETDRPTSFAAAHAKYTTATNQMADQIVTLAPGMKWKVDDDSWNSCGVSAPAEQVYRRVVFDHPIPDDLWPTAVQIVKDGAARFGATTVSVAMDQPGNKDLTISGSGAEFELVSNLQAALAARSDCLMPETHLPTPMPTAHP
jgi:hypothetical protein